MPIGASSKLISATHCTSSHSISLKDSGSGEEVFALGHLGGEAGLGGSLPLAVGCLAFVNLATVGLVLRMAKTGASGFGFGLGAGVGSQEGKGVSEEIEGNEWAFC